MKLRVHHHERRRSSDESSHRDRVGQMDRASIDYVLTTTRNVRKRLDLTRAIPELIEECIDLAVQAPTGCNAQTWRFLVVTDPEKRGKLAELYTSRRTDSSGLQMLGRLGLSISQSGVTSHRALDEKTSSHRFCGLSEPTPWRSSGTHHCLHRGSPGVKLQLRKLQLLRFHTAGNVVAHVGASVTGSGVCLDHCAPRERRVGGGAAWHTSGRHASCSTSRCLPGRSKFSACPAPSCS